MPATLEKHLELTVDDLISAVAHLPPGELSDFELRFDELRLVRLHVGDEEAAQIAEAHRLPAPKRGRAHELLTRNRETGLKPEEEKELDGYMAEMERRLEAVADEILSLAARRKQETAPTVAPA